MGLPVCLAFPTLAQASCRYSRVPQRHNRRFYRANGIPQSTEGLPHASESQRFWREAALLFSDRKEKRVGADA
jgi:hypothetical protein